MHAQPPQPTQTTLYRPFFTAGIAVALTAGAGWGVWLLWQIGFARRFTGVSIHEVNAHGHAQIFGWVGLFVMGFAYQMFPAIWQRRLAAPRLVPFVFATMLCGIVLRTVAMAAGGAGWAVPAVMAGGGLEIAAIGTFVAQVAVTWRRSLARGAPYLRFIGAALGFFLVQAIFCVWHTLSAMGAPDRDALLWQVATYQAILRDLQVHGFALFLILGVSMRVLPRFYGLPEMDGRRARRAWWLLLLGVLGETGLFLLYRFTGRHVLAAALLVPWGMLAWGALSVAFTFRPWRAFPLPDRSAKFVRFAYLWLAVSFALLLLLPVYQSAVQLRFSHAYYGSIRHAITVGFASQMIMGIAAYVVPTLRRRDRAALPNLGGPFLLINLGCLLRVTLQALTDVHPAFFAVVGVSGVLELAALSWWGVHLARLMFARQESQAVSAGALLSALNPATGPSAR